MKVVRGDLLQLAVQGEFDVIIHGCNCFCHMGGGIAKAVQENFPQALEVDQSTIEGDRTKLGTYTSVWVNPTATLIPKRRRRKQEQEQTHEFCIVNAYTQYDWRPGRGKHINSADYGAIHRVFTQIRTDFHGQRIGYSRIGAGSAGGDWIMISAIIEEALEGEDHTVVEHA